MILFKEKRKISVLKNENCHTSNTVHYILQYPKEEKKSGRDIFTASN